MSDFLFSVATFIVGMGTGAALLGWAALTWPEPADE
jgi:hypothetical protein